MIQEVVIVVSKAILRSDSLAPSAERHTLRMHMPLRKVKERKERSLRCYDMSLMQF